MLFVVWQRKSPGVEIVGIFVASLLVSMQRTQIYKVVIHVLNSNCHYA